MSILAQSRQTDHFSSPQLTDSDLGYPQLHRSSKDLAPTSSTLMGTIIGCNDDERVGKKKKLNSSFFSFPLSIATYDFLRREDWKRVREKILMEDIANAWLVNSLWVGWEG